MRELKNFVRRAFIMAEGDELDADMLTPQVSPGGDVRGGQVSVPVGETLAEADRRLILATPVSYPHLAVASKSCERARRLGRRARPRGSQ